MYKVTKAFIYRAKLYPIGRKLTENEYERMTRDRVAVKRGIPEKVSPLASPVLEVVPKKVETPAAETPAKKPAAKKPTAPRKPAAKKPAAPRKPAAKKAPAKKPAAKKAPKDG